jgi:hypothetical protein
MVTTRRIEQRDLRNLEIQNVAAPGTGHGGVVEGGIRHPAEYLVQIELVRKAVGRRLCLVTGRKTVSERHVPHGRAYRWQRGMHQNRKENQKSKYKRVQASGNHDGFPYERKNKKKKIAS